MRVTVISIPVRDQAKALAFYTDILGFVKKLDIPLNETDRWLTVVSPEDQDGVQLVLEPAPLHFEPSRVFQDALMKAGYPYTQFDVDDVQAEYDRLLALGVSFSVGPKEMGTVKVAVFNDTCGNNIQLVEYL